MVAEAGVEQAMLQLNQNENFTGDTTEQVFFNNTTQGREFIPTTVTDDPGDTNAKIITSTGKVYRYNQTKKPNWNAYC